MLNQIMPKNANAIDSQDKPENQPRKSFLKKHWISFAIITGACLATGILVYLLLVKVTLPEARQENIVTKKHEAKKFYSNLSHIEVDNEDKVNSAITAIMIENSLDARPQSGLKSAEVVFEAIAEGGITRFMALYQANKPQLIGPVRSVRKYYLDWAKPFNASIGHVGGSDEALNIVRNGSYRDIDQFFNGNFYWRSTDRYAPHNVYTSFEKLDALNLQKGYTTSPADVFARAIPKLKKDHVAKINNLHFKISGQSFNVDYTYDKDSNTYLRSLAGQPHLDREAGRISPNSVVAIMVDFGPLPGGGTLNKITTIANDKAYIFQNGEVIEGTWKKPSLDQQIRFYDSNDKEIAINAGQVWITAVPKSSGAVTWE
ncbi:MAG: DUF3048 domain-containing protein [Candidatus Saccharibacteria bacterium]|nr:DUF3048 domain-containing protein [Candidatus Saccharibacteria bacterium]